MLSLNEAIFIGICDVSILLIWWFFGALLEKNAAKQNKLPWKCGNLPGVMLVRVRVTGFQQAISQHKWHLSKSSINNQPKSHPLSD